MKNKRFVVILLAASTLLLIPFVAKQFSQEVNWTSFDFLVMGILLYGAGLLCELIMRAVTNIRYRKAICVVVLLLFIFNWAELAVGVVGTPFAGD